MRVVSNNSPSISLITQASGEAGVGTVTNASALGGRQIVTVPAGQAGLTGAKGPVQITITPASRSGTGGSIIPITLPTGLRQVTKPLVVGGTASASNGAQVFNIRGASPAQVVAVNPGVASTAAGSGDQPAQVTILRSEADSLTEAAAVIEQNSAAGDSTTTIQQFDGAADCSEDQTLSSDEKIESDGQMFLEGLTGVCAESDTLYDDKDCYFLHSSDHEYAVGEECDSDLNFEMPQLDGAGDEDGGGEEEKPAENEEQGGLVDQQEQPEEAAQPMVTEGTEGVALESETQENPEEGIKEEAMQTDEGTVDPSLIDQVSPFNITYKLFFLSHMIILN